MLMGNASDWFVYAPLRESCTTRARPWPLAVSVRMSNVPTTSHPVADGRDAAAIERLLDDPPRRTLSTPGMSSIAMPGLHALTS